MGLLNLFNDMLSASIKTASLPIIIIKDVVNDEDNTEKEIDDLIKKLKDLL